MIANAIIPTTALPSAWLAIAFHGDGKLRKPSTTYNPMNTAACSRRRADEHHQPRQRRGDDELLADRADGNPTIDFARPPMPTTPLESAS